MQWAQLLRHISWVLAFRRSVTFWCSMADNQQMDFEVSENRNCNYHSKDFIAMSVDSVIQMLLSVDEN